MKAPINSLNRSLRADRRQARRAAVLILLALLAAQRLPTPVSAADGDLDPSFGSSGIVVSDFGGDEVAQAIAVQRDGKIVVAGGRTLARYHAGGSPDDTFGVGGEVTLDFAVSDVAVQRDGKIVVAGEGVARYRSDGGLDDSFGVGGKVMDISGNAVAIQRDDKIVVAGGLSLARCNAGGSPDDTFGVGGKVLVNLDLATMGSNSNVSDVALQADGKIVVAGTGWSPTAGRSQFALARYNQDGSLDASFGTGCVSKPCPGMVFPVFQNRPDRAHALVIQPDGKIIAAGEAGIFALGLQIDFALVRYNIDGTLDSSFGPNGTGKVVTNLFVDNDIAFGLALQPDGKIIAAGKSETISRGGPTSFAVVRYNADGSLDSTFGTGGIVTTNIGPSASANDVAVQADGKIIVAGGNAPTGGQSDFVLARYQAEVPPVSVQPAQVGVFRRGGLWLMDVDGDHQFGSPPDTAFLYGGLAGDIPIAGDWDGDGVDTVGVYRNGVFFLRNSNTAGYAEIAFPYGQPGDVPIAGDWDGDGADTVGIFRSGVFYLRNSNNAGYADIGLAYGAASDTPIAGDWDGDGRDTVGVYRSGVFFLRNSNTTGYADLAFAYGTAGDLPVVGDWDGDGLDTAGVYRSGYFLLRNTNTAGYAEIVFNFGLSGDLPTTGVWGRLP